MGGCSGVITGDTEREVLEEAVKWYEGASKEHLHPRDYVYGKGNKKIEFIDIYGEKTIARVVVVDMEQRPKDAQTKYPFPMYSSFLRDQTQLAKRFHAFVSASA